MPKWKRSGRDANKAGPAGINMEVFQGTGTGVRMVEKKLNCKVLFWHVGEEDNLEATALAKEGLKEDLKDWT